MVAQAHPEYDHNDPALAPEIKTALLQLRIHAAEVLKLRRARAEALQAPKLTVFLNASVLGKHSEIQKIDREIAALANQMATQFKLFVKETPRLLWDPRLPFELKLFTDFAISQGKERIRLFHRLLRIEAEPGYAALKPKMSALIDFGIRCVETGDVTGFKDHQKILLGVVPKLVQYGLEFMGKTDDANTMVTYIRDRHRQWYIQMEQRELLVEQREQQVLDSEYVKIENGRLQDFGTVAIDGEDYVGIEFKKNDKEIVRQHRRQEPTKREVPESLHLTRSAQRRSFSPVN